MKADRCVVDLCTAGMSTLLLSSISLSSSFPAQVKQHISGITSILRESNQGPITQFHKEEAKVWNLDLTWRSAQTDRQKWMWEHEAEAENSTSASVSRLSESAQGLSFCDYSVVVNFNC